MDRFQRRLGEHPSIGVLESIQADIQTFAGAVPEDQLGELARVQHVLHFVKEQLNTVDPQLLSQFVLRDLKSPLDNLLIETQAVRQQMETGESISLTGVNDVADEVLDQLGKSSLPTLGSRDLATEAGRAVQSVTDAATTLLKGLRQEAESIQQTLAAIKTEGDETRTQNETTQQAFEGRLQAIEASVDQQASRIETVLQEQATRFDEAQERRLEEFTSALTEHKKAGTNSLNEISSAASDAAAVLQEQGAERLAELDERRQEAEKLVGVIAREGMTAGYQREADGEQTQANWLRALAILLGLVAAGFLAWGVLHAASEAVSATNVTVRLALTAAVGGVAGYAARESAKHRETARRLRSIQLSLASIGPYLAQLDDDRRAAVVEAFSYVFFAPTDGTASKNEQGPNTAQGLFLDFLAKMTKPSS